jgi:nucleotide-binding universal stress UspA family protein
MDLKRILCPVDFSDASNHAIEHAAAIAGYYGAGITALHLISPVEPWLEDAVDTLRQKTREFFTPHAACRLPVDVIVDVAEPVAGILTRAASLPADLIVMGTHGLSGFKHFAMGSVAEDVLRKAPCPVLAVPPRAHMPSRLPFHRVLCAVDASDASLCAAQAAASLAHECGASLTLLHVIEWPWPEPPAPKSEDLPPEQALALASFRRDAEARARRYLAAVVSTLTVKHTVVTSIAHGTPHEQILDAITRENIDVVVIGVAGRSALALTLLGSTANRVLRAAPCPVLTVRQLRAGEPAGRILAALDSGTQERRRI